LCHRQHELQATVTVTAQALDYASGSQSDSISDKIEPIIQSKRAKIVLRGDQALNQFQVRELVYLPIGPCAASTVLDHYIKFTDIQYGQ
jgi:hypothetical protein